MRGEEETLTGIRPEFVEIPPRARGREISCTLIVDGAGNTPACAGKSKCNIAFVFIAWKYPRVRGEESAYAIVELPALEIPPRARGREMRGSPRTTQSGNTPACAGKSGSTHARRWADLKYPRVRGEEKFYEEMTTVRPEIPPRARGRV